MKKLILQLIIIFLLYSCSSTQRVAQLANKNLFSHKVTETSHIGISIFNPATGRYLYNHQAKKYFVPASNVKIVTCYAAMKYLGDSLKGIQYDEKQNLIIVEPTGDPTFLHPDFAFQPVYRLLEKQQHILINTENWSDQSLGSGWSWDDYNDAYMTEKSPMPVYGNMIHWRKSGPQGNVDSNTVADKAGLIACPSLFQDSLYQGQEIGRLTDTFDIIRNRGSNQFLLNPADKIFQSRKIPFVTNGIETTRKLLRDTIKTDIRTSFYTLDQRKIIYSQPTDSVLKIMMHQSDNFLAEQLLLMVSNEQLKTMNTERITDTLLQSALSDFPQKPRWADGSGLSRYNLFTPQDFVFLLNKMNNEFGINRLKGILPTSNEGTLKNYFLADSSSIYAKTGSLSGVVALSGYLYTKKISCYYFLYWLITIRRRQQK